MDINLKVKCPKGETIVDFINCIQCKFYHSKIKTKVKCKFDWNNYYVVFDFDGEIKEYRKRVNSDREFANADSGGGVKGFSLQSFEHAKELIKKKKSELDRTRR